MLMGIFILVLSGICQGSFGLGYKKYSPLSWEAFWGVYSLFCLIVAAAWTFIICQNACIIISESGAYAFVIPFICGMVWGVSTIAFSKSVLMIGMSLCFGVNMGISSVVGTVIPFISAGGAAGISSVVYLAVSIIITLIGITVITKAGLMKDKVQKTKSTIPGILLAIISGLCSGIMNVGFDKASVMGNLAENDTAASAIQWFPVLTGGMAASIICCVVLMIKNKTINTFAKEGVGIRLSKLFATSIVWFAALALYGIASKMLGDYGSSIGWLVFNAIALIVSSFWGLITGEWKNAEGARKLLYVGDIILIVSWIFLIKV